MTSKSVQLAKKSLRSFWDGEIFLVMRLYFEPAADELLEQQTRPRPVGDEGSVCWRSGQKLQAHRDVRNFWAPQECKQTKFAR